MKISNLFILTSARAKKLGEGLTHFRSQVPQTSGTCQSKQIYSHLFIIATLVTVGGLFLFSQTAYAVSNISVSSSGTVSFGKVQPSSSGTIATGEDTLAISTDCEAGVNVYATSVNGSSTGTSLINQVAKSQDSGGTASASYTINTSSSAIGSAAALTNNTWGLNTNSTEAANNSYYGLPDYSSTSLPSTIFTGALPASSGSTYAGDVPVYYGAKITNTLTPGTYTGTVLYTVTVSTSCLDYTVKFDKNNSSATGDMADQTILPTGGNLTSNSFTYSGYEFLGWSLDPAGKTGTAVDGIGTAEDVDYEDGALFPDTEATPSVQPGSETTLYAIWSKQTLYMQDWLGCGKMTTNQIVTLTDSRDNHEYKVKKLPDGKCWMIQNLTLTATDLVTEGKALTNANTNIPSNDNNLYYVPPQNKSYETVDSINNSAVASASASVNFDYNSTYREQYSRYPQVGYRDKDSTDSATGNPMPENTAYYNFYTATLGYSYYNDTSKSSGSSPRDICPKGWRLPWVSDSGTTSTGTGDMYTLTLAYNSSYNVWTNYITPGSSSSNNPYTSDTTVRQNMIKGDSGSLDPELDTNGAAGFTYAGFYSGTALNNVGANGDYWSSSIYNTNLSYILVFNTSYVYPQGSASKYSGNAVRCVAQYSDVSGYMQDFDSSDLASGESTTLLDKRDNQEYTVYRIPTDATYPGTSDTANVAGKVIMTKDLNLGAVASVSGSASTITAKGTMNLSPTDSNFTTPTGSGESISVPTSTTSVTHGTPGSGNNEYTNRQYRIDGTGDYAGRGYYTWGAAMLACPKGWRLPTEDEYIIGNGNWEDATGGLAKLVKGSNASQTISNITSSPYSFVLGGLYNSGWYDAGSSGRYWSSTQNYSDSAYYLRMYSSNGLIRDRNYKRLGFVVRCIAQDTYTINYNANGGTGEMAPSKGYIGGSTLSQNTFTRDGYYFVGWSTDPSATTATYTNGATITDDLAPAGGSVTLYAVWTDTPYFQIGGICSAIPEGQTTTLIDKRDNQEYTVYRIPSNAVYPGTSTVANVAGKCIMTKDLNLGAVASVSGSASTITAQGTMNLSPEDSNFTTPTGSGESISVPTSTTSVTHGTPGSGNNDYTNRQYRIDGTGNYAGRGYYTWGAAMLACPKGWRLPTQDEYNNNDSSWNASTTGISKLVNNNITTIQQSPYSFVLGGFYFSGWYNAGSFGYYWSSTQSSSDGAYSLFMRSSNGLIRDYNYKSYGFVVRCIAE